MPRKEVGYILLYRIICLTISSRIKFSTLCMKPVLRCCPRDNGLKRSSNQRVLETPEIGRKLDEKLANDCISHERHTPLSRGLL